MVVPIALYSPLLRMMIIAIVIKVFTHGGKIVWGPSILLVDVEHFKNIYWPFEFMCAFISSVQLYSEIHIFFLFIFKRFCFQCLRDTMIYSQTHRHTNICFYCIFQFMICQCSCKIYFHISPKILSNWVCHFFFLFPFSVCVDIQKAVLFPEIC